MTNKSQTTNLAARHERQRLIRAKIKLQIQDKSKNVIVRKVWLLPSEMCDRIVDYQEAGLIRSEAEVARRLLDIALQARGM